MGIAIIETPLGSAEITGDTDGISSIKILEENAPISAEVSEDLKNAILQLKAYFKGELHTFNLKLNPSGTDFQKRTWKALLNIPFGKTTSYLELSKQMGDVKAIRAVAAANGKNPLRIVIPCHRVIGSDGSLTGYAGGLWRKKWLLEHENPSPQQELF